MSMVISLLIYAAFSVQDPTVRYDPLVLELIASRGNDVPISHDMVALRAKLEKERRDGVWADRTERDLTDRMASSPSLEATSGRSVVTCAASVCEIAIIADVGQEAAQSRISAFREFVAAAAYQLHLDDRTTAHMTVQDGQRLVTVSYLSKSDISGP